MSRPFLHRQALDEGKLAPESRVRITRVGPIRSASDLEFLIPGAGRLPKITWQTLSGGSDDYYVLLDKLFNPSDVDSWLRIGDEKRKPTPDELQAYIDALKKQNTVWRKKPARWIQQIKEKKLSGSFNDDFDRLFYEGLKTLIYPSRETFRQLMMASATIAHFQAFGGAEKKALMREASNATAIYVMLTTPAISMVRFELADPYYPKTDYFFTPGMIENPMLQGVKHVGLDYFVEGFRSSFPYWLSMAEIDKRIAENEKAIAENKKDIANNKEFTDVMAKTDRMAKAFFALNEKYNDAKDPRDAKQLLDQMKSKIDQIRTENKRYNSLLNRIDGEVRDLGGTQAVTSCVRTLENAKMKNGGTLSTEVEYLLTSKLQDDINGRIGRYCRDIFEINVDRMRNIRIADTFQLRVDNINTHLHDH